jgi:hypothetical protein
MKNHLSSSPAAKEKECQENDGNDFSLQRVEPYVVAPFAHSSVLSRAMAG